MCTTLVVRQKGALSQWLQKIARENNTLDLWPEYILIFYSYTGKERSVITGTCRRSRLWKGTRRRSRPEIRPKSQKLNEYIIPASPLNEGAYPRLKISLLRIDNEASRPNDSYLKLGKTSTPRIFKAKFYSAPTTLLKNAVDSYVAVFHRKVEHGKSNGLKLNRQI